jgi:hypothetical protein
LQLMVSYEVIDFLVRRRAQRFPLPSLIVSLLFGVFFPIVYCNHRCIQSHTDKFILLL